MGKGPAWNSSQEQLRLLGALTLDQALFDQHNEVGVFITPFAAEENRLQEGNTCPRSHSQGPRTPALAYLTL